MHSTKIGLVAFLLAISSSLPTTRAADPSSDATPLQLTPGVWTDITPPASGMKNGKNIFCQGFAIDPRNPATIYAGICAFDVKSGAGLYKTTNGGATWRRVGQLDEPVHVVIDPKDSNHLYCVDGVRGGTMGFWVSTDGGETWKHPAGLLADSQKPMGNEDMYAVDTDPADFNHVLVSFHSHFSGPWTGQNSGGIVESTDGGEHWIPHSLPAPGTGNTGASIFFLDDPTTKQGDSKTWLLAVQSPNWYRTTDGGATWSVVYDKQMTHGGQQLYRTRKGDLYAGGYQYPTRSTDNGKTWQMIAHGGLPYGWYIGIYGDGTHLFTASTGNTPFFTSPEDDGQNWTPYHHGEQKFAAEPFEMHYDATNGILYSANWGAGLYALKIDPAEAAKKQLP